MKSAYRTSEGRNLIYRALEIGKVTGKNALRVSLAATAIYLMGDPAFADGEQAPPAGTQAKPEAASGPTDGAKVSGAAETKTSEPAPDRNVFNKLRRYSELSEKEFEKELDTSEQTLHRYSDQLADAVGYRNELRASIKKKETAIRAKLPQYASEPNSDESGSADSAPTDLEIANRLKLSGQESTPASGQLTTPQKKSATEDESVEDHVERLLSAAKERADGIKRYMTKVAGDIKYLLKLDVKLTEKVRALGVYTDKLDSEDLRQRATDYQPFLDRAAQLEAAEHSTGDPAKKNAGEQTPEKDKVSPTPEQAGPPAPPKEAPKQGATEAPKDKPASETPDGEKPADKSAESPKETKAPEQTQAPKPADKAPEQAPTQEAPKPEEQKTAELPKHGESETPSTPDTGKGHEPQPSGQVVGGGMSVDGTIRAQNKLPDASKQVDKPEVKEEPKAPEQTQAPKPEEKQADKTQEEDP